jgi:N-acylneuraminate cytidylyltransferase
LGRPLIDYTIDAAQNSHLITKLILSSDDQKIITYCKQKNVEVPFVRPKKIAEDDTPMLEVVKHSIRFLQKNKNYIPDLIILLQPTSPLRTGRHIDEALNILIDSGADSIVSVIEIPHNFNPYSVMKFNGMYLSYNSEFKELDNIRQKKPKFYARNGPAILAFTYHCLINKNSMYGEKILPYFMKREESIDIDTEFDFKIAEYIIENKRIRD